MEMKTRILLLGILSILYGLFVTDIKYPRIDELRCYIISLNVPMLWWQKLVQNGGRPPYSSSSIFKIMIVPLNEHYMETKAGSIVGDTIDFILTVCNRWKASTGR